MSEPLSLPLNMQQLFEFLPHRYPFIFIDRITELNLGEDITGIKSVTMNEWFFQGHFPDNPIMPGVLIIEAMAQVSGILSFATTGKRPAQGYNLLFAGVDDVKFKRQVTPGDMLTLKSTLLFQRRMLFRFQAQAYVGDELAVSAIITLAEQKENKENNENT